MQVVKLGFLDEDEEQVVDVPLLKSTNGITIENIDSVFRTMRDFRKACGRLLDNSCEGVNIDDIVRDTITVMSGSLIRDTQEALNGKDSN